MTNGERIKKLRENLGINLVNFANKLSVDVSVVSDWENGTLEPTANDLKKISFAYSLEDDYFDYDAFKKDESVIKKEEASNPKLAKEIAEKDLINKGNYMGNCAHCGNPIYTNDDYHFYPAHRGGGKLRHEYAAYYLCKGCFEKEEQHNKELEQKEEEKKGSNILKYIIIGIIIVVILIVCGVLANVK